MMDAISELIPFLNNSNPEVRLAATQGLSSYTVDKQTRQQLAKLNVIPPLVRLLGDISSVAYHAVVCLVNFSEEEDLVKLMLKSNTVKILVECIINDEVNLIDLYSSLLSNLTLHEEGCGQLTTSISPDKMSRLVLHLLSFFEKDMEKHPGAGMALVNITQLDSARTALLGVYSNDKNSLPLLKLLPGVSHKSLGVRRTVLRIIRNCSFYNSSHDALLGQGILIPLLEPLRGMDTLDDDDMVGMPSGLHAPRQRETDIVSKQLIVDILILFTHHRAIRDRMRAIKMYSILRDWEKVEENETLKESIYRLVELLLADEEDTKPTNESTATNSIATTNNNNIEQEEI